MMDLDLSQVDFSGVDLSGANLQNANLRYANLRDADLSGANLYNADLSFADLRGVDLSNVNLTSAKVYKAKFEEKAAERVQLAEVTDDAEDTAREVTKIQYILTEVEEKQERRRHLTLIVVAFLDLFILAGILYLIFFYG
ncbi:MAG: pentapeptide repeat-containing protein [Deltaproteobacteria bacterium]|nr:MAG: pentapeptide repeat-containing protein [Deltaproteobacteria bacterium]